MNLLLRPDLSFKLNPTSANINFSGKWKNELGSTMEINQDSSGLLIGLYSTAVGQPTNIEVFPLSGLASGDLIGFTVNFGKYGSLTSWTGQMTQDSTEDKIYMLWHMAVNVEDHEETKKIWGSVWTGYNNFIRIK